MRKRKKKSLNYLIKKIQNLIVQNTTHVLNSAINGNLTKNWRLSQKSVPSSILQDISINRRKTWEEFQLCKFMNGEKPKNDSWKKKYREPLSPEPFLDELSTRPQIPEAWSWVTLDQITWFVRDGPHYSPEYTDDGIPFITGGNVRPWGVDFDNAKYISSKLHKELSKRCKPEKNDILYTKGGTTGIARVNTYDKEFNVWVHVAVLKLVEPIVPFYIQHALNSEFCYSQAQHYTHGVGNKDLGLTRMIRIVLPLPPGAEQLEIVKTLDSKLFELEQVNAKIENIVLKKRSLGNTLDNIESSVLHSAFSGKLVN